MCMSLAKTKKLTVVSNHAELPRGSWITIQPGAVRVGDLVAARIGRALVIGRWFHGWIVQPSRWIDCGDTPARILGRVVA